ncbi:hypothetical protein V2J09_004796 [Rumex salicifolius]
MGGFNGADYIGLEDGVASSTTVGNKIKKVSLIPLIFLIFYEVSGGPFGIEDTVGAAGPLLALVGFLVFPLIWSVPEALITSEMGTMFPENGGYVVWVSSALGEYWGFQQGWMKWLSGVIDNALYPVLFLDYLKSAIPALSHGYPRVLAVLGLTGGLTFMNYRGMVIVGWVAVLLGAVSILPFAVMALISIPKLKPSRWVVVDLHGVNWGLYLNTLFWNLNYWDSISTLAGEVENPRKTLPKALFYALIFVVAAYFFPLLAGTGAIPLDQSLWSDGYFSDVAKLIGGAWLSWWIQGAAAMSNMGMFVAEMSSDSFQLLGMAERGMVPEFFGKRSRHGTPWVGILFSASGVILLSWLSFDEIVAAENFLYCFGMILEFIAFVMLRIKQPNAPRPYKVPVGTIGCIFMCIPPTILICVVLALSSVKVMVVSLIAVAIGLVLQPALKFAEKKSWLKFSILKRLPVKTLLRFRCVCNWMKETIGENSFMLAHLSRQNPVFFVQSDNATHERAFFVLDPNSLPLIAPLTNPFGESCILGTLHGVVCLYDNTTGLHLWNPSTHQSFVPPLPQITNFTCSSNDHYYICAFWIDPSTRDFKVIVCHSPDMDIQLEAVLYNSVEGRWMVLPVERQIPNFWFVRKGNSANPALMIGAMAYWIFLYAEFPDTRMARRAVDPAREYLQDVSLQHILEAKWFMGSSYLTTLFKLLSFCDISVITLTSKIEKRDSLALPDISLWQMA